MHFAKFQYRGQKNYSTAHWFSVHPHAMRTASTGDAQGRAYVQSNSVSFKFPSEMSDSTEIPLPAREGHGRPIA